MKALIICPTERKNTQLLAQQTPLAVFPVLGKPFVFYSIEHLAAKGAKKITVLAADRPEQVRAAIGDGSRWGVEIEVFPEQCELSIAEARKKYRRPEDTNWLADPDDAITADHWPTNRQCDLFSSYANLFAAVKNARAQAEVDRIGLREIEPGIWVGNRTSISPTAQLKAPCWIGNNVSIAAHAVIGPAAVVDDLCVVDAHSEITNSLIAPETFVGKFTSINNSIALGNTLINWSNNSHAVITDPFLLCGLNEHKPAIRTGNLFGQLAAATAILVTAPFALLWALQSWFRTQNFVQERSAVIPGAANGSTVYFEFTNCTGYWQRWPQLFNIMRGEFAWVGNRPLTWTQVQKLTNEYEKLWLTVPVGVFSQADVGGCGDSFSDESKAHASFYAAQANWRLDLSILRHVLTNLRQPRFVKQVASAPSRVSTQPVPIRETMVR
jgi:hypothetical protein